MALKKLLCNVWLLYFCFHFSLCVLFKQRINIVFSNVSVRDERHFNIYFLSMLITHCNYLLFRCQWPRLCIGQCWSFFSHRHLECSVDSRSIYLDNGGIESYWKWMCRCDGSDHFPVYQEAHAMLVSAILPCTRMYGLLTWLSPQILAIWPPLSHNVPPVPWGILDW